MCFCLFLSDFWFGATGSEPVAVISCLKDMTVVGQSIEEGCCHFGVSEDIAPFPEAQIGCDNDTGPLVETAEQMEQKSPT